MSDDEKIFAGKSCDNPDCYYKLNDEKLRYEMFWRGSRVAWIDLEAARDKKALQFWFRYMAEQLTQMENT